MKVVQIDFETYSAAGYTFNPLVNKWQALPPTGNAGIKSAGSHAYAAHPSTDVLCLAYDMGAGVQTWRPYEGDPLPTDLTAHVRSGGRLSAWNSEFELCVWNLVLRRRDPAHWPPLPIRQTQDTAAAALAKGLPASLGMCAKVLDLVDQKMKSGASLITRFCKPRSPTKNNRSHRTLPTDDPTRAAELYAYCAQDVRTEAAIAARVGALPPDERAVWLADQRINSRGVAVDTAALERIPGILDHVSARLELELRQLTGGRVTSGGQIERIATEVARYGLHVASLDADHIVDALGRPELHPTVRRILEIRQLLASSSTKKVHAIARRVAADGRVRGTFKYHGAARTGRWAGAGPQPHNIPQGNGPKATAEILDLIPTTTPAQFVEHYPNTLPAIAGSLRGMFVAAPGHRLLCSDYRAIESVVAAEIAGEPWRQEVFRTHGKIYEMSASKITGVPFEEFISHKERTGEHHPHRNKIGKVAELASGYGGAMGAWCQFGADKHMTKEQITSSIERWRDENSNIVKMWRGLETAAVAACQHPGRTYSYRCISYWYHAGDLVCTLPSGRTLTYPKAAVILSKMPWGKMKNQVTYAGVNIQHQWVTLRTYGGKLFENVVQAISRDILAAAVVRLERARWPIVLHVHDEICCEVPNGTGHTVAELERLMSIMPPWAAGWPVIAAGGWGGHRYRK